MELTFMQRVTQNIMRWLGSKQFFYIVLAFFALEALWVAFSAVYPMAFDEEFHLGIIKIYSEHWLPFLTEQPANADMYGALATDPSYLYHYLMSFPYRLIALITDSQAAQVIFLRILNIGLFGLGLVLFRKVLLRAKTSPVLTHTAILLLVLIPIVPLLAGQINYDNALLPMLAWICLLVFSLTEQIQARKVNMQTIALLVIVVLLTSLIKYAFLPMAVAVGLFLVVIGFRAYRGKWKQLQASLRSSYRKLGQRAKVWLFVGLAVSGGLFIQRYGMNAVNYGTPLPDCSAVIGVDACMSYGPWARNFLYEADPTRPEVSSNPVAFTWTWLQGLHYRLFFMITGPSGSYVNYPPAPLPSAAAIVIGLFGVLALLFYWRQTLLGRPFLIFLLFLSALYVASLWYENYTGFLETDEPVAINGRYLVPVLLPMVAVFGRALVVAFRQWPAALRTWAVLGAIALFLQAGGVFSFILRSDVSWYWPNSAVQSVNENAQKVLDPVIFQGPKHY
jgi:hypothetical protein